MSYVYHPRWTFARHENGAGLPGGALKQPLVRDGGEGEGGPGGGARSEWIRAEVKKIGVHEETLRNTPFVF